MAEFMSITTNMVIKEFESALSGLTNDFRKNHHCLRCADLFLFIVISDRLSIYFLDDSS